MSAADAALAAAELAGVRLYLRPDGQVGMRAAAPPPADVVADLRRWRDDVAHLLALRGACAGPSGNAPPSPPAAPPPPPPPPPTPVGWLGSIARSIRAALADGAVRVGDTDGGLTLVRADGRHLAVAAHTVAGLAAAGLLPDLPPAVDASAEDDPDTEAERIAERGAIQSEPRLPPLGTPARTALDQRQAEMVSGLLEAALVRPPCFEGTAASPPPKGSYCSCCRGTRWWFPRRPTTDGTGISAHWRCTTCRPPPLLRADQIVEVAT